MFKSKSRRCDYAIKSYYKGFVLSNDNNEFSREEKKKFLIKIYLIYKKEKRFKDFEIDDDATIDEAILLLAQKYNEINKLNSVYLKENSIVVSRDINARYDSGAIPLLSFFRHKKDKEFFNFLMRILRGFQEMNFNIMDNYIVEGAMESIESEEENYTFEDNPNQYFAIKTYRKLIMPSLKFIPDGNARFTKKEIKYFSEKYPDWAQFIHDFMIVLRSGVNFMDVEQMNIDASATEEGYLDIHDMFWFRWCNGYLDEHPFDGEVTWQMDQAASSGYYGEPSVSVDITAKDFSQRALNLKVKKVTNLLNLFIYEYPCFRYFKN